MATNTLSNRMSTTVDHATRPRVLMISNFLAPQHGSRAVQQDIRERLERLGYEITAASSFRGGLARGSHMVLSTLLNRGSYDVALVDVYSRRAFLWAEAVSLILSATKRPFVLVLHGGNLPIFAATAPARVKRTLSRATIVVAPSRYLQEQMAPYRADIELIPNGIDLSHCTFRARTQPGPRLIWLRALHAIYNPTMAVRVAAALAPDFPETHLSMVGPDKMDGSAEGIRSLATELGVSDRVSLTGGINKADVPAWLGTSDIFINTTNADNTPVSVLEAMACGLPVVSTDVGGLPYLLEDGHDALLVPKGDDVAMANAVRRLILEPDTARTLAVNARAKVEGFDWPAVIPRWTETLARARRTTIR